MSMMPRIFPRNFTKRERSLGVARQKRKYDLPLEKGNGGRFLKILMGLMTILAMFAFVASFALSDMTERWSSGLSNKATIEIPAETKDGTLLSADEIDQRATNILEFMNQQAGVANVDVMTESEIQTLVVPWLGENIEFENVPLPGILSVEFFEDHTINMKTLEERLQNYGDTIRLDTHSKWLDDVLKFTGALNLAALLISALIGITTIIAAAGAVQARMSMYRDELELLHLMGAADRYISRQLQRYTFISCLQGAAIGTLIGFAIFFIVSLIFKEQAIAFLPNFNMSLLQFAMLCALPFAIALLGMVTARQTVLSSLVKML